MEIYDEIDVLYTRIWAAVKAEGLDREALIDRMADGLVSKSPNREFFKQEFLQNRRFIFEKFFNNLRSTFSVTDLNDVLRCIFKLLLGSHAYKKLINEGVIGRDNLCSISDLCSYDPFKNGQNILKHGIPFHAVHSYSRGTFHLISPNGRGNQVVFSRYYYQDSNHCYMFADKPDRNYDLLATVVTNSAEGGWRFITSRVIKLDGDIKHQLELLIWEEGLDAKQLDCLRTRALEILQESTKYGMSQYPPTIVQHHQQETEL